MKITVPVNFEPRLSPPFQSVLRQLARDTGVAAARARIDRFKAQNPLLGFQVRLTAMRREFTMQDYQRRQAAMDLELKKLNDKARREKIREASDAKVNAGRRNTIADHQRRLEKMQRQFEELSRKI